jgi:hypothetical protein
MHRVIIPTESPLFPLRLVVALPTFRKVGNAARGTAIWIHSNLTAPRRGDHSLGVAPDTEFGFATAEELHACVQELIAVLRRIDLPTYQPTNRSFLCQCPSTDPGPFPTSLLRQARSSSSPAAA